MRYGITFYFTDIVLSILLYFRYRLSLGCENGLILNFLISCVVQKGGQLSQSHDTGKGIKQRI